MTTLEFDKIRFDRDGLVPAVVQDWRDGTVLMIAFMNREAIEKTLETRSVHFWSRSRKKLWEKGETSGHRLSLKALFLDCDQDAVLVKADPTGPTCHTGERACFFAEVGEEGRVHDEKTREAHGALLDAVLRTIASRKDARQSGSYVSSLFEAGQDRILRKVSEEAGEVLLASKDGKREEVIHEVADLWFHTLVLLGYHEISLLDIYQELASRFGRSGLRSSQKAGEGS